MRFNFGTRKKATRCATGVSPSQRRYWGFSGQIPPLVISCLWRLGMWYRHLTKAFVNLFLCLSYIKCRQPKHGAVKENFNFFFLLFTGFSWFPFKGWSSAYILNFFLQLKYKPPVSLSGIRALPFSHIPKPISSDRMLDQFILLLWVIKFERLVTPRAIICFY